MGKPRLPSRAEQGRGTDSFEFQVGCSGEYGSALFSGDVTADCRAAQAQHPRCQVPFYAVQAPRVPTAKPHVYKSRAPSLNSIQNHTLNHTLTAPPISIPHPGPTSGEKHSNQATMSTPNKTFIFKKIPQGLPVPGQDLVTEDRPIDLNAVPKGGLVVKNLYASYDPYQRGRSERILPPHNPNFPCRCE